MGKRKLVPNVDHAISDAKKQKLSCDDLLCPISKHLPVDPVLAEIDHHYLNEVDGLENPTTEMIADIFTKAVDEETFFFCKHTLHNTEPEAYMTRKVRRLTTALTTAAGRM